MAITLDGTDGVTTTGLTSNGIDDNATSTAVTIDSSGNVGIGTTLPNSKLHTTGSLTVNDKIYLQRNSSSLILPIASYWDGSGSPLSGAKGDIVAIGNTGGDGLVFANANVERMRLDASGNVLVGRTNTSFGSGTNGAFTLASGRFLNEVSGDTCLALNRTDGTGSAAIVYFYRGNNAAGQINTASGGTPAFASSSDIRLKDNVTDHESELANVMSLRPVRWDWKDERLGYGEGFVAQELEQTAWADLVSEGDDGYKVVSGLGAVETRLIKALQEAVTRIETLEAEVAALKGI